MKFSSFVTDNAANMKAMRRELHNEDDTKLSSLITYGCSAHIANLLVHDLDDQTARNHVVQVIKHIRYNHSAAAKFKKAGGMKLPLPGDTIWNSVSDALESYLKQWSILVDLDLETEIQSKIMSLAVKSNAKDLLERLKHVSKATDLLQSNDCYLSKAVTIWKNLNLQLYPILSSDLKKNE